MNENSVLVEGAALTALELKCSVHPQHQERRHQPALQLVLTAATLPCCLRCADVVQTGLDFSIRCTDVTQLVFQHPDSCQRFIQELQT